jgi:hypothetical protein
LPAVFRVIGKRAMRTSRRARRFSIWPESAMNIIRRHGWRIMQKRFANERLTLSFAATTQVMKSRPLCVATLRNGCEGMQIRGRLEAAFCAAAGNAPDKSGV